jgi:diacylglycerol kinase family enzyme
MTIILYNPKSRLGNNQKLLNKIEKMVRKEGHAVVFKDVLTIGDASLFLDQFKIEDRFIIVGGDGTLHQLVNRVQIHHMLLKTIKNSTLSMVLDWDLMGMLVILLKKIVQKKPN